MFSTSENRVQLIGFLGQEIEVKEADGKKVARMSMATSEIRKTEDGGKETITTWHSLVAHGKNAELMARIFSKGQRLYIEGKLTYHAQVSPGTRIKRHVTEIVVTDFKRLERDDHKK